MRARRVVIFPVTVIVAFTALLSCSKEEEPEESIRDRVVAASKGYRDPAEMRKAEGTQEADGLFAETGFAQAFHGGDWIVDDPFTDSTKFFMSCSLISHSYPYVATQQALARSARSEQQVFLVAGSDPALRSRLDQKMTEWASSGVGGFPKTLRSADGVELNYRVYHIRPGLIGGEELLLEVAWTERNGKLLLLDGGLSYGRPSPPSALQGQPQAHATLQQLVPALTLRAQLPD